jgi:methionyl-tRNA formyltransferase
MIPHDLPARMLRLPETNDHSMVVITGRSLSHHRMAYRLQHDFGPLVRAWFELPSARDDIGVPPVKREVPRADRSVGRRLLLGALNPGGAFQAAARRLRSGQLARRDRRLLARRRRDLTRAEERLFGAEVEALRRDAKLQPIAVASAEADECIRAVRALNPYCLISSERVLPEQLLECVRGPAIAPHAGWSPAFDGSNAVELALYHRNLDCVGATVHLVASGLDAGPILRRSHPCLLPWDSPEDCLIRVMALGTELICEVVREITSSREIALYDPSPEQAETSPMPQLDGRMLAMVYQDFSQGWLGMALHQARQF